MCRGRGQVLLGSLCVLAVDSEVQENRVFGAVLIPEGATQFLPVPLPLPHPPLPSEAGKGQKPEEL